MPRLLLVRHGHVEGIDPVRFRGRVDIPLTSTGKMQASRLAARLLKHSRPAFVYTSPMSRCVDTGEFIANASNAASATLEYLNDLDYGNWQWLTHNEAKQKWPEQFETWLTHPHLVRFPGGESLQDLVQRTADALRYILEKHAAEQRPIVLVGHDSVNRALLMQLLDQPLSSYWRVAQSPCAINEFEVGPAGVHVLRVNDTAHLEEA